MKYDELADILRYVGKDPSRLIFEDELTGIHNRRYLLSYLEHTVDWHSGDDFPLSLLSIDLDHFKEINDTHGHDTGDRVLTWVATLLTSVGGEESLAVRFGGDEFLLLLPGAGRAVAQAVADRLLQSVSARPYRDSHSGLVVPLTMSVGFAVAPDDAIVREDLLHAADTALYHAKQAGRNRASSASGVDEKEVFQRTALQKLKRRDIAGREQELEVVEESLGALSGGQSQVLVFEGAPGAGKTTLLDTVRRGLQGDRAVWMSRVSGDPREARRPYYLIARILIDLLSQAGQESATLLDGLSPEERSHLAHVLPALLEGVPPSSMDKSTRRGIFMAFIRLLGRVVKGRPLVLLVDDLQFVDEATLALVGAAVKVGGITVLMIGTANETLRLAGEIGASPVERFIEGGSDGLTVRRLPLAPFTALDVTEYLQSVFPNVEMPPSFETTLVRITSGNPSFIAEIVRGLLADGKVRLEGQNWVVGDLDEAYLTRSVEDIVTEKIAALDEQDRELLERASTLGEETPVSILAGSSDVEERSVQEFLERAEDLGLVSLDFQLDDEVLHFLGKRVLEISYSEIDEDRRRELHEEVGRYHEQLHEGSFSSSASMLAYHFRRSANEAKAQKYEEIHRTFSASVFELGEVDSYSSEEELPFGSPLDEATARLLPGALRLLLSAMRNTQLYPPESMAISRALAQAKEALDDIVTRTDRLTLTHSDRTLLVNGEEVALPGIDQLVSSVLEVLTTAQLSGISLAAGVTQEELQSVLTIVGHPPPGGLERGFWMGEAMRLGLQRIQLSQTQYARVKTTDGGRAPERPPLRAELSAQETLALAHALRDLLKTASHRRLYPMGSDQVTGAIEEAFNSLSGVLTHRPLIALSRLESYLLVNGARIDTARWQTVADGFIRLLDTSGLVSLTFTSALKRTELEAFFVALGDPTTSGEPEWWERFEESHGLEGILFNREAYAIGEIMAGEEARAAKPEPEDGGIREEPVRPAGGPTADVPSPADPAADLSEATVEDVNELLVQGNLEAVSKLLKRSFASWLEQDPAHRTQVVETCLARFRDLPKGLRRLFAGLSYDAFAPALRQEHDPGVLRAFAAAVFEMGGAVIKFSDHQLAGRMFGSLTDRRRLLEEAGAEDALRALNAHELDKQAQQLLVDDLRSGLTDKMSHASLVLGRLGPAAIDPLVMTIMNERELRVRQLAADLLTEVGGGAAAVVKDAILTEVLVEHRYRLLEVADIITQDLRTELVYCLVDENAKIRRAAFQVFERLGRDDLVDLMPPLALDEDAGTAKGAIRSLASMGTPAAAEALVGILEKTKVPGVARACCKALGSLRSALAVGALDGVLTARKLFGYKWDENVRAAAALALRQIATKEALLALSAFAKDPSPRIREVARPPAEEA